MHGRIRIARAYLALGLDPSGRLLLAYGTGANRGAFLAYLDGFYPWKSQRPGGLLAGPFHRLDGIPKRLRRHLDRAARLSPLETVGSFREILETRQRLLDAWLELGPPCQPGQESISSQDE